MKRNKYERIQLVRQLSLNTEENILIRPEDKKTIYKSFLDKLKKCSIRTFNKQDSFTSVHHPILTQRQAFKVIPELQQQNYYCILATPIDPKYCEFAGAARKTLDDIIIEVAYGAGTVRRITHEGKIDKTFTKSNYFEDEKIMNCYEKFKNCYLNNIIFEFSWYKIPVGWKKENFICWEITDDGTNNSGI